VVHRPLLLSGRSGGYRVHDPRRAGRRNDRVRFSDEQQPGFSHKGKCIAAQGKSDRPVSRVHFGEISKQGLIRERDATISLPETFKPGPFSNGDWDRGISRGSNSELLVGGDNFGRLLIKKGDEVQISPTDRRTIISIAPVGTSRVLTLDGSPIRLADGVAPVFWIVGK
jgi:hypothetical protein